VEPPSDGSSWADRFEFYKHVLYYEDPDFFDRLHSSITSGSI
jgi:hypothetical protein